MVNLEEYAITLHGHAKDAMVDSLIEKDKETFVLANVIHNISHGLIDILKGDTADKALKHVFEDENDDNDKDSFFAGTIAVNVATGEIDGIEDIKNPKLKRKLAEVVQKLADNLGEK